jgi:hypothetical protein
MEEETCGCDCECDCEEYTWLDRAERLADNIIRIAWIFILYNAIFHERFIIHVIKSLH